MSCEREARILPSTQNTIQDRTVFDEWTNQLRQDGQYDWANQVANMADYISKGQFVWWTPEGGLDERTIRRYQIHRIATRIEKRRGRSITAQEWFRLQAMCGPWLSDPLARRDRRAATGLRRDSSPS